MYRSIKFFKNLNTNLNLSRKLYNDHLTHPRGTNTIRIEQDDDQKMFACIHLEPTFPYEHTKPLPQVTAETEVLNSVLKNEIKKDEFHNNDLTDVEVQRLTYTSHHFWKKFAHHKRTYKKKVLKPRDGI